MSLTLAEVEQIAKLARLNLTDEEKSRYREQLSSILDYVTMLQELDTTSISTTSGVQPDECLLRVDDPVAPMSTSELLKNSPATTKNQFKVPPVFE
ncbi:MAG: Asp-tRNA(Asn)/Glu-tRNA(Gln) amidotransferase subunit GatC [Anaerolineae bacterium]|nr:Asp-tRNA(Asn)/Glu-tRNA(Gln) amidotransferase subunit GatC [Anaerolineae bacterium]